MLFIILLYLHTMQGLAWFFSVFSRFLFIICESIVEISFLNVAAFHRCSFHQKKDNLCIYKGLINGRKDLRLVVSRFVVFLVSARTGIQNRKGLSLKIFVFLS